MLDRMRDWYVQEFKVALRRVQPNSQEMRQLDCPTVPVDRVYKIQECHRRPHMVPSGYQEDRTQPLQDDSDDDLSFLDVGPSAAQYLQNKRPRTEVVSCTNSTVKPVSHLLPRLAGLYLQKTTS